MSQKISDGFDAPYDPKKVEKAVYQRWQESGFFNPDNLPIADDAKTFTMMLPPPNVTGVLHMGHALNATVQDILIRKKRMEGYRALWVPGTDHAGIATQNVVEKDLKKQDISRHDLGREKFLEKVWEWKEKYGNIILDQLKTLGASCDWSRTVFTMDDNYKKAVETAFKHYYEKGLIYQGERVINWCARCATSLSDLELEYKEEKGTLYYIKYPLKDDLKTFVVVATTRPETMLGDTAVAVHPDDTRYKALVGKILILPIQEKEIPLVADSAVEKEFGTGAVKVTPAHSIADFEIGLRHKLPLVKVIDERGKMTKESGICEGLNTQDCRAKVVETLNSAGLLEKEESITHNVAHCYRCDKVIEQILSKQWFVNMEGLAKKAADAVRSGAVSFYPKNFEKPYLDWLDNTRDWCVSRQIWWGHRIPLWKCATCDTVVPEPTIKSRWFVVRHGETDWNKELRTQGHTEVPLNETGRQQARETGIKLNNKKIDLIVSSDLGRCKETAEIITKELGGSIEIVFDSALRERHYGVMEGSTKEEREEKYSREVLDSWNQPHVGPPEGESWQKFEARILEVFSHHKSKHTHKNIVLVTHGGPIRMIRKNIKNLNFEEASELNRAKNAEIFELTITQKPCPHCGGDIIEEVSDVLDTWFSSALWPFATLGWPSACSQVEKSKVKSQKHCEPQSGSDLERFYPTSVLTTGRDIINLWVSRMIFSGLEFMDDIPFSSVYINPTVLAKDGRRMSKSLGTGIDPLVLVEKYGADATRFGLIWQMMGVQDMHFSEEHLLAGKKFSNKLWNIARFVLQQTDGALALHGDMRALKTDTEGAALLEKLNATVASVAADIDAFRFGQALHALYDFVWHDFADVYIEHAKTKDTHDTKQVLSFTLVHILKLLHPFMPFVTEEIYGNLNIPDRKMLLIESWPAASS